MSFEASKFQTRMYIRKKRKWQAVGAGGIRCAEERAEARASGRDAAKRLGRARTASPAGPSGRVSDEGTARSVAQSLPDAGIVKGLA